MCGPWEAVLFQFERIRPNAWHIVCEWDNESLLRVCNHILWKCQRESVFLSANSVSRVRKRFVKHLLESALIHFEDNVRIYFPSREIPPINHRRSSRVTPTFEFPISVTVSYKEKKIWKEKKWEICVTKFPRRYSVTPIAEWCLDWCKWQRPRRHTSQILNVRNLDEFTLRRRTKNHTSKCTSDIQKLKHILTHTNTHTHVNIHTRVESPHGGVYLTNAVGKDTQRLTWHMSDIWQLLSLSLSHSPSLSHLFLSLWLLMDVFVEPLPRHHRWLGQLEGHQNRSRDFFQHDGGWFNCGGEKELEIQKFTRVPCGERKEAKNRVGKRKWICLHANGWSWERIWEREGEGEKANLLLHQSSGCILREKRECCLFPRGFLRAEVCKVDVRMG